MLRFLASAVLGFSLLASPAFAFNFCPAYGVKCYRPAEKAGCPFLEIGMPDGDYMGSIFMPEGTEGWFACSPVLEEYQSIDYDRLCNELLSECQGQCVSE